MKTLANIIYWAGVAVLVLIGLGALSAIIMLFEIASGSLLEIGSALVAGIIMLALLCIWHWARDRRKES
jgi:hypothetical protein